MRSHILACVRCRRAGRWPARRSPTSCKVPAAPRRPATSPTRGMSMEKVEANFGAPSRRVPAVGGGTTAQPPITRWEYPGFVVYFENSLVIHTVATPG